MKTILFCAAALIAVPAFAQNGAVMSSQPTGAVGGVTKIADDPEKLICRKETVIGSLIAKKRVCATARNWERNEARAKEHLDILTAPGAFAPSG